MKVADSLDPQAQTNSIFSLGQFFETIKRFGSVAIHQGGVRYDPACVPPQIGGPPRRRSERAVAHQAMAESSGRRRGETAAHARRQGQQTRHGSWWGS